MFHGEGSSQPLQQCRYRKCSDTFNSKTEIKFHVLNHLEVDPLVSSHHKGQFIRREQGDGWTLLSSSQSISKHDDYDGDGSALAGNSEKLPSSGMSHVEMFNLADIFPGPSQNADTTTTTTTTTTNTTSNLTHSGIVEPFSPSMPIRLSCLSSPSHGEPSQSQYPQPPAGQRSPPQPSFTHSSPSHRASQSLNSPRSKTKSDRYRNRGGVNFPGDAPSPSSQKITGSRPKSPDKPSNLPPSPFIPPTQPISSTPVFAIPSSLENTSQPLPPVDSQSLAPPSPKRPRKGVEGTLKSPSVRGTGTSMVQTKVFGFGSALRGPRRSGGDVGFGFGGGK